MKPSPYGPFPYSPIVMRARLEWPNGARVALWLIQNIEFFPLKRKSRPGRAGRASSHRMCPRGQCATMATGSASSD